MEILGKAPVGQMAGKPHGKADKNVSARRNGQKSFTYTWPENYVYPQIPARMAEVERMKTALAMAKEAYDDPEKRAKFEEAWKKAGSPGRLWNYVIGCFHRKLKEGKE